METKIFEILDRSTYIPVMGVRLQINGDTNAAEHELLRHAGYGEDDLRKGTFVVLSTLSGGVGRAVCDPYDWGCHTLTAAHAYIAEHWNDLRTGDVVDAEFARGESTAPKTSQRYSDVGGACDETAG